MNARFEGQIGRLNERGACLLLGTDEIGTVEVGKRANLLLLQHDPTLALSAYDAIDTIILGGRELNSVARSAR